MKKLILLSLILFSLAACQKEEKVLPKAAVLGSNTQVKPDTIPDNAAFKIKLVKDSTNGDETMICFNHLASLKYSSSNDAPYLPGFGKVSLASISADGIDLAINKVPYTPGMPIGLNVHTKTDGAYLLETTYKNKIPASVQVWLMDNYPKDSVNIGLNKYNFNVIKADTNSFGSKRFRLVLKDAGHQ